MKMLGEVKVSRGTGLIALLQDAAHDIRLGVQTNRPAHKVAILAEPVAPQTVSQDSEFAGIRRIFRVRKGSSEDRLDSKHVKESCANVNGGHPIEPLSDSHIQAGTPFTATGPPIKYPSP